MDRVWAGFGCLPKKRKTNRQKAGRHADNWAPSCRVVICPHKQSRFCQETRKETTWDIVGTEELRIKRGLVPTLDKKGNEIRTHARGQTARKEKNGARKDGDKEIMMKRTGRGNEEMGRK